MPTEIPLTLQQRWRWNLCQRHDSWNVVLAYAFRLLGELHVPYLLRSFVEVVRRSSSLRTRIIAIDGVPTQQVDGAEQDLVVAVCDASSLDEVLGEVRAFFAGRSGPNISVAAEAPFRVKLYRVTNVDHVLALSIHGLIADCFSIDKLLVQTWQVYDELFEGKATASPAARFQYSDYAIQQERSQAQWNEKHGAYWTERLSGAVPVRWPVQTSDPVKLGEVGRLRYCFGELLSSDLKKLAMKARTLSGMVMLAVYVSVLSTWCNQSDFVVPFNVMGRQPEHQNVAGCFAHVLYLRVQPRGTESFLELVRKISREFFQALSHDDFGAMSIERPELLEGTFAQWISWHPDDSCEPAQVTRVAAPIRAQELPAKTFGLEFTALPPGMVGVEANFLETDRGIYINWVYRADVFTAETIQRLAEDVRARAEQFVAAPMAIPAVSPNVA